MNAIKIHKIANKKKAQVQFGAQHGGKWHFQVGKFTLITKVKGGLKVAEQIGEVLRKDVLTHGEVTDEARAEINTLLQVKTLADYREDAVGRGFAGMVKTNTVIETPAPIIDLNETVDEQEPEFAEIAE